MGPLAYLLRHLGRPSANLPLPVALPPPPQAVQEAVDPPAPKPPPLRLPPVGPPPGSHPQTAGAGVHMGLAGRAFALAAPSADGERLSSAEDGKEMFNASDRSLWRARLLGIIEEMERLLGQLPARLAPTPQGRSQNATEAAKIDCGANVNALLAKVRQRLSAWRTLCGDDGVFEALVRSQVVVGEGVWLCVLAHGWCGIPVLISS